MAISKKIKKKEPKNISSIKEIDKQLGKESGQGATFGQYSEAHGGGTPAGGDFGGRGGRVGWNERKESGEHAPSDNPHRAEQPRTSDGKFTYNSVNGKETKYDGRGKTVNPLLTGGENGVKISEAKEQFQNRKGSLFDKYKSIYYQKGSEKAGWTGKKFSTKIASNDIWDLAKYSFNVEKGEFGGKTFTERQMKNYERKNPGQKLENVASESSIWDKVKRGMRNKREALAGNFANKRGKEAYVTFEDLTNEIYKQGYFDNNNPSMKLINKFAQTNPTNMLKAGPQAPTTNVNLGQLGNIASQFNIPKASQPSAPQGPAKVNLSGFKFKKK